MAKNSITTPGNSLLGICAATGADFFFAFGAGWSAGAILGAREGGSDVPGGGPAKGSIKGGKSCITIGFIPYWE